MTGHGDERDDARDEIPVGGRQVPGVLDALREGWHGLGGGDAARCPGCPVCRISESAGRMDPATAEHLQAAAVHLVSAGRELLAALAPGDGRGGHEPANGSAAYGSAANGSTAHDGPAHDRLAHNGGPAGGAPPGSGSAAGGRGAPVVPAAPPRTRIHVDTGPTSPARGNEEQA